MVMGRDDPILVVGGAEEDRVVLARILGGAALALVTAGTAAAGTLLFRADVSWTILARSWRILVVPAALGAYLGERFMRPSAGSVAFYEARIVISKWTRKGFLHLGRTVEHTDQILWSELKGFEDGRSDYVRLVVEKGQSSFLTVPTIREEDRVAVLRVLDEHGIPRLE